MCKEIKVNTTEDSGATIVELAVIVPMIWVIIMGSILLLFFFFDMGVIRSQTARMADEVAQEWRLTDHKSISEEKSIFRKNVNERLIMTKLETESISVSLGTVTVKAGVSFRLAGKGLTFSLVAKAAIDNRETWLRVMVQ